MTIVHLQNPGAVAGAKKITPITGDYEISPSDHVIEVTGNATLTLPPIADAVHEVTIIQISGRSTLVGDAAIEEPTTVTPEMAVTLNPVVDHWSHS